MPAYPVTSTNDPGYDWPMAEAKWDRDVIEAAMEIAPLVRARRALLDVMHQEPCANLEKISASFIHDELDDEIFNLCGGDSELARAALDYCYKPAKTELRKFSTVIKGDFVTLVDEVRS